MEKQCSKCNEVKPISEFGMKRGKVGGMSWCKICNRNRFKKFYKENTQYVLTKNKNYVKDNYESVLTYRRNYANDKYKNCPEFRFANHISKHIQGIKNRQDFKDLWDEVRKDYDEKGISYHIDHLIPQSWFLIRTPKHIVNHLDNLQVIDAHYNMSKKHRWSDPVPSEYLDKIRPYIKKKFKGLLKSL